MCYTDEADNFYLFDWKRSKQIKKENRYRKGKHPLNHLDDANYWHYALQLNIYKYILEKNYIIKQTSEISTFSLENLSFVTFFTFF